MAQSDSKTIEVVVFFLMIQVSNNAYIVRLYRVWDASWRLICEVKGIRAFPMFLTTPLK
jgi:hypothetical protein